MAKPTSNTAFLLRTWAVSLIAIGFSIAMVVMSFGQGGRGSAYVVLGSLAFAIGLAWFARRYALRGFARDFLAPSPDALIERSQRALGRARVPHARELLALGMATSRAFYGQFGRARDELAEVSWEGVPALYRGSALQLRALIHYLSGDDPAAGLRCAREALELVHVPRFAPGAATSARVSATYVDIGRVLVEGASAELAPVLEARVAKAATPQERLITLWGAALAQEQLNRPVQAEALFAQLRAGAPHCRPLHAPPARAAGEQVSDPPGRCARHPEVTASARCVRCGDFVCGPCRRPIAKDAALCPPCRDRYAALREEHLRAESHLRSAGVLAQVGAALLAAIALCLLAWPLLASGTIADATLALFPAFAFWSFLLFLGGRSLRRLELGFRMRMPLIVMPLLAIVPAGWLAGGYVLWLVYGPSGRAIQSLEYQRALAATPELSSRASRALVVLASLALFVNLALIVLSLMFPFLE